MDTSAALPRQGRWLLLSGMALGASRCWTIAGLCAANGGVQRK
jgi:hypothetical protein